MARLECEKTFLFIMYEFGVMRRFYQNYLKLYFLTYLVSKYVKTPQ